MGRSATMEIRGTRSVGRVGTIGKSGGSSASAAVAPSSGPRDVLSIAGLTEAELTPRVRQAMMELLGEVDQLRRELNDSRARIAYLEKLVDEDPLMPVANRRAFVRELTRMMGFAERYGVAGSIVYFDVNNMKQINDVHGHSAGDAALLQVARLLIENVRNTDVVGRLGGDELGVLLVQADLQLAETKAANLVTIVQSHPLLWQGHEVPLSVAYGVYSFAGGENAGDVIEAADRAMYENKRRSRRQEGA
jgi:diguanylate cyclase (GGDEF)-like protein